MGFLQPTSPDVDAEAFLSRPFLERIKVLALFWADHGFGSPVAFHLIYITKVVVLYCLGGLLVVSWTSDVGGLGEFTSWWDQAVVYQKLVLWTVLLEAIGIAGTWGPLAGHFKPMTGGARYWLRPGTIRMAPWASKVPGTGGDTRTPFDVALYALFLASLVAALVMPTGADGLVRTPWWVVVAVLLVLLGLRDKVIFLASRGEQYLPAMIFSATLTGADLIIAYKLLIVTVWIGAGVSKFGHHFVNVVPPMLSNAPTTPARWIKRLHYRDVENEDLLPSKFSWFMAHVGGTTVELAIPLVLLFATNREVAVVAACFMAFFHLFILTAFPLAVPLEWNVLFGFLAVFLFVGYPNGEGYGVFDFSEPFLLPLIVAGLVFFPVLGNLRPDLVSFLPSMRQYAGNWASATWVLKPGIEQRFDEIVKPAANQIDQLQAFGFDALESEMTLQKTLAWRAMHSQGRGLYSLLLRHVDDVDARTIREAEFMCNLFLGWNFGCGHLHDERLIAALQRRLHLEPGDFQVMWVESQAIGSPVQHYRVIDAALGVVERGHWYVAEAVAEQPWLPNGPISLHVDWTLDGYVPAGGTSERPAVS
ncbi:MAG: DUF3556 domain-containing protein [Aeromicrobium sp.]|uniref:DUF3556 domain-containing protein n=1 Tax=Aeromicrobium sp. TaxID=1871063 RepID=UPI0039E462C9